MTADEPRYAFAWAVLACVLAALTLGHPALGGQFLVNPVSDQYIAGYAFRDFAAASLRAGEGFPLWNPYLFGGMPYVAAMHGDIFYPTFLLRMVLPTDAAMTWGMILHLMFAGVAGYAFLRAIGLGFHAALVGGLAYMMSGQVASLVSPGHDGKLFVSALLPLTLLVLTYGVRDAKHWAWGVLALVVGLGVLSPHPQLLQYLLLASGAWALMLAFGGVGERKLLPKVAITRLGLALGAVLLGAAIGAIQYLPVREYVEWSPRAGGRDTTTRRASRCRSRSCSTRTCRSSRGSSRRTGAATASTSTPSISAQGCSSWQPRRSRWRELRRAAACCGSGPACS
jgi:hypothetical protein